MTADAYTGPQGGDWLDPANWSNDTVPLPGTVADVFLSSDGTLGTIFTGVDATAGTVTGLTIDLSGTSGTPGTLYGNGTGVYYQFAPNLTAYTLGSSSSPVTLDVSADGGSTSQAGLLIDRLYGSINVASGQSLSITRNYGGPTPTDDGVVFNGDITIGPGAVLTFENYYAMADNDVPVTFNGLVDVQGGTLNVNSNDVSGTGSVELGDGGTAAFTPTLSALVSLPVTFDSSGGTLNLSFPSSSYTGTIAGFGPGDLLIASDEFSSTSYPFTASYAGNVLTITPYESNPEQFQFAGDYTLANFDIFYGDGGIEVGYQPCFATGTAIAAPDGMRLVESLALGDLVLLAEGGTAPIVWIGHRRQKGGTVVRIRAHALAPNSPTRDLLLSEDHGLYLDGVLIQAGLLVNGETIRREPRDEVTFWHVELDRHAILLADGAPAESYLDTGNRRQFANCVFTYDPAVPSPHEPCAEMVFAGPRLDAVRAGLRRLIDA